MNRLVDHCFSSPQIIRIAVQLATHNALNFPEESPIVLNMKSICLAFITALVLFFACKTTTKGQEIPRIFPDSNITPSLLPKVLGHMNTNLYPDCPAPRIRAIALISLEPTAMKRKNSFAIGDIWTEKILFDACGEKATHRIHLTKTASGTTIKFL